ncbi:microtubule-associated serine/threonine-protein kinase 2-like [Phyllobates terribilis]|uniref:microtubule-associated serine/threonine-protein kinase 2-like n=1 Tax=Phyllobates terribilis TaxID=111132 RepID=UPI003CCB4189
MFLCLPLIEHTCFYNIVLVARDIIWDCNSAPTPNAQNLITELLRTNPADRLGTGGSLEIKSHPFLSDLDFNNLLSQKPEYIPQLASDVDNSLFIDHSEIDHSVSEDEEGTSENNENLDFQNFTSSSERLSKLCTITTRTMNDEDQKSPPECTPATNTNISEIMGELEVTSWVFWSDPLILPDRQKESFSESDSDNAINSLPSSSPSSGMYVQHQKELFSWIL